MRLKRIGLVSLSLLLLVLPAALANHGDIHAKCVGNQPVITARPPGTENVVVTCRDGVPEFMVDPGPVATYNPVRGTPQQLPPDFAGWVTVWLNGHPLRTPYNPTRGVFEPGAYLAKSTGRVMMPVRFFTEAFGGQVDWKQDELRARLMMPERSLLLMFYVGSLDSINGGRIIRLDQAPLLFQGRVFVPARFLLEGFGAQITWDHFNRSARVTVPGATCSNSVYCGEVR
jgi:hypothetical protein